MTIYSSGMDSRLPIFFFAAQLIIGNTILLKLFIAIMIYNFGKATVEVKAETDQSETRSVRVHPVDESIE